MQQYQKEQQCLDIENALSDPHGIYRRIKYQIQARNKTQEDIAYDLQIDTGNFSRRIRSLNNLSEIHEIADAIGCMMSDLLFDSDPAIPAFLFLDNRDAVIQLEETETIEEMLAEAERILGWSLSQMYQLLMAIKTRTLYSDGIWKQYFTSRQNAIILKAVFANPELYTSEYINGGQKLSLTKRGQLYISWYDKNAIGRKAI